MVKRAGRLMRRHGKGEEQEQASGERATISGGRPGGFAERAPDAAHSQRIGRREIHFACLSTIARVNLNRILPGYVTGVCFLRRSGFCVS
jgi:hypothetical protein